MDLNLAGKKAVITGGTRGIGRAIADTFAEVGVDVALCARDRAQVQAATAALRRRGVNAMGSAVDVADAAALQSFIQDAGAALGGIDILIANPSAFGVGNSEEDWRRGFDVDLMGTVRAVAAATPFLERAAAHTGDAAIVIMSSAAVAETDYETAYGAFKAALIHFAKGVARRLAPKGVRANIISPGTIYVEDGFWGNAQRHMPDLYDTFLKRNPTGRMGNVQELANVAAFLASPLASFTSGANVVVDGAFTGRVHF